MPQHTLFSGWVPIGIDTDALEPPFSLLLACATEVGNEGVEGVCGPLAILWLQFDWKIMVLHITHV